MRRALLSLALLAATPVAAQEIPTALDCQTRGYCTNALECHPDSERFRFRGRPDGTWAFGWTSGPDFVAKPLRRDGFIVFTSTDSQTAVQILVLSDSLDATFTVIGNFAGLYHSTQVLTCQRAAG